MSNEPIADPDNPEWSEDDFRRARPAAEFLGPRLTALLASTTKPVPMSEADWDRVTSKPAAARKRA